jgi:hypothetical protein
MGEVRYLGMGREGRGGDLDEVWNQTLQGGQGGDSTTLAG